MAWIPDSLRVPGTALTVRLDARPVRFVAVGVTGVGVSTAVLWATTVLAGLPTAVGGIVASILSTFTNFLLNDAFTWRDRRSRSLRIKAGRLLRYYTTTALGNLIYVGVLTALTHLGLRLVVANVLAIGVGGTFNYLLHNVWTWRALAREHRLVPPKGRVPPGGLPPSP